ncbi:MAG: endolytic transglycosylase MltG [Acidimicrobiales bacterium]
MSHFSSAPVEGGDDGRHGRDDYGRDDYDDDDFDGDYEYDDVDEGEFEEGEAGYEDGGGAEAYHEGVGDYEDGSEFADDDGGDAGRYGGGDARGDDGGDARGYGGGDAAGYGGGSRRQGAVAGGYGSSRGGGRGRVVGSGRDYSAAGGERSASTTQRSAWDRDGGSGWERSSGSSAAYRAVHASSDAPRQPVRTPSESFIVNHRRPPWIIWVIGAVVLLLVVIGIGAVVVRNDMNPGHPGPKVSVTIPKGASTDQIGTLLAKAGVIDGSSVFRLYTKVKGVGVLLPGTYHLPRNSSYHSVVAALEAGPPIVYQKFTIPEGFTLAQIADRVGSLPGRSASDFLAAANSGQVRSQLQPPGSTSLEGLLFPATYTVRADATDLEIVQTMVQTFDDNVANLNLTQVAATLGVTPYQVIVVASMVEREAKLDVDRGPIASVIYNRLKANMLLQIDATVLYGEGITDPAKMDKNSNTPYNTYKFKGLPPTPISCPGLPSLTAAANPPTTNYLYYVVIDSSGKSGFAATAQEFQGLLAQAHANGVR